MASSQINPPLIIITGASKGLGAALCEQALSNDHHVIAIARTPTEPQPLDSMECDHFLSLTYDLSDPVETQNLIKTLSIKISLTQYSSFTLVNNAGTVEPMGLFDNALDSNDFSRAFELNVLTPMKLTQWFIEFLKNTHVPKKIVNISSGAGRKAVPGWGVYCATKAALDRFSEVIALEQNEVLISSLAPGVIDTQMQETIRTFPENRFPTLSRFTQLHENNELSSARTRAKEILQYIESDDFGQVVLDDIRHHLGN